MQRPVRKLAAPAALRFECGARNPLEPNERERTYERGTASFEYSSESPWTNHLVSGERAPCFPVQSALFRPVSLLDIHGVERRKGGREWARIHIWEMKPSHAVIFARAAAFPPGCTLFFRIQNFIAARARAFRRRRRSDCSGRG